MLFVSHKLKTNTCAFCNQLFLKDKVEIFGYQSINEKAAICSSCLLIITKNAISNKVKTSNNKGLSHCDFCSKSIPDVIRVFSNGNLGICEECISSFISTSLWIGKKQGVEITTTTCETAT